MNVETLHISLIQADLAWEQPSSNRQQFEEWFKEVPAKSELVILPEMFTTGFTMHPAPYAEAMSGDTVSWLKHWASQLGSALCGSLIVKEENHFYNRFLFVTPEAKVFHYDKRHTFNMAGEGEKYTAGKERVVIDYLGWKIFPQICYDLRFPVFSRNIFQYDLLLYVANWPEARVAAWDALLRARAIENMSYCVGVNRTGKDGNGLQYVGHSAVYDALGNTLVFSDALPEKGGVLTTTLSKKSQEDVRAKLPFLEDRDSFTLQ